MQIRARLTRPSVQPLALAQGEFADVTIVRTATGPRPSPTTLRRWLDRAFLFTFFACECTGRRGAPIRCSLPSG
jgi:hypothetical protein